MWIARSDYDAVTAERIKASEQARLLAEQLATTNSTLKWALHRLNQVEHERALLLKQYMGVAVKVPNFVPPDDISPEDVFGGASVFRDIGDEAAKREGIEWDDAGVLK